MSTCFQAESRARLSKTGLKNLRREGRLPANVFGNKLANEMIHISAIEFQKWLKQGASGFIELQIEGKGSISVLLEDLQRDPRTRDVLHVDFQQVQTNAIVRTKIPVKFVGTPAGARFGGVVQIQNPYIEVEALPAQLPHDLEFDISGMMIGDSVLVKDVPISTEVTLVSGPNECLASVVKP